MRLNKTGFRKAAASGACPPPVSVFRMPKTAYAGWHLGSTNGKAMPFGGIVTLGALKWLELSPTFVNAAGDYLLPLSDTTYFAQQLGIAHPQDPATGLPAPIRTTFVVVSRDLGVTSYDAYAVVRRARLADPRVAAGLRIQNAFWASVKVPFHVLTDDFITHELRQNAAFLLAGRRQVQEGRITAAQREAMANALYAGLAKSPRTSLDTLMRAAEHLAGAPAGTAFAAVDRLIWEGRATLDLQTRIDVLRPAADVLARVP